MGDKKGKEEKRRKEGEGKVELSTLDLLNVEV